MCTLDTCYLSFTVHVGFLKKDSRDENSPAELCVSSASIYFKLNYLMSSLDLQVVFKTSINQSLLSRARLSVITHIISFCHTSYQYHRLM